MTGMLLLLLMVCSVLLAIRAAEVASEIMFSASLTQAVGWIGLAVLAMMALFGQWVAFVQLPAGGRL